MFFVAVHEEVAGPLQPEVSDSRTFGTFLRCREVGVLLRMLLILGAVADYGGVAQQSFQLRISFSISLNLPNMIS